MSVEPLTLTAFAELAALVQTPDSSTATRAVGRPPSLSDVLSRAEEIVALARRQGLSHVRVVGSIARGTEREDSDLDLLVHGDTGDTFSFGRFQQAIAGMFGCRVDVIPDDELPQAAAEPSSRSGRLGARLIADAVAL